MTWLDQNGSWYIISFILILDSLFLGIGLAGILYDIKPDALFACLLTMGIFLTVFIIAYHVAICIGGCQIQSKKKKKRFRSVVQNI